MANNLQGYRIQGAGQVHNGAGRLLGYHLSHCEATSQTVTFFDGSLAEGAVMLRVHVAPNQPPIYVRFGLEGGLPFRQGLAVEAGSVEAAVWLVGYVNA